ncbi:hypothetical protein GCM10025859_20990 [Alicyclobacillus fastidiosus]|nr:hypothetical protein GCM10025859_20990 [Alicyclobacillus fastidiosus]
MYYRVRRGEKVSDIARERWSSYLSWSNNDITPVRFRVGHRKSSTSQKLPVPFVREVVYVPVPVYPWYE